MPEGRQPRRVTPHPWSGAAAENTKLQWCRNGREERPCVRGQGGQPRGDTQRPRSGAAIKGVTPCLRSGAVAGRSNPMPKARGGGQEDQPHVQGAMAAWAQEGLEELSHFEGQEGRR